jgi:hypothetical protein
MCLDELSFGGMLKRCGLLRGGRRCGGRDGVTPLMFAARTELTLHRTNRFGNSSRFERRSSAAYAVPGGGIRTLVRCPQCGIRTLSVRGHRRSAEGLIAALRRARPAP